METDILTAHWCDLLRTSRDVNKTLHCKQHVVVLLSWRMLWVGYTVVWSGIHGCIPRETVV